MKRSPQEESYRSLAIQWFILAHPQFEEKYGEAADFVDRSADRIQKDILIINRRKRGKDE